MKKIITLLLCLSLVCVAASSLALGPGNVAGIWYLNQLLIGGFEMDTATYGTLSTLVIDLNGTAVLDLGAGKQDIKWHIEDDVLHLSEETGITGCTIEEGKLVAQTEIGQMIFERQPGKAASQRFDAPNIRQNAAEESFNGNWKGIYCIGQDTSFVLSDYKLDIQLSIGEGHAEGYMMGMKILDTPVAYADGSMTADFSDGQECVIYINTDNTLRLDVFGYSFYCVRMK